MLGTNNFNPYQKEILKTTHSKYKLYDITHFQQCDKVTEKCSDPCEMNAQLLTKFALKCTST